MINKNPINDKELLSLKIYKEMQFKVGAQKSEVYFVENSAFNICQFINHIEPGFFSQVQ